MFYVYVLFSTKFDKFYVGMTEDLGRRLKSHNQGMNTSTKTFLPWKIVHNEVFETRLLARQREKYLKSAAGRRWRKQNIRSCGATG